MRGRVGGRPQPNRDVRGQLGAAPRQRARPASRALAALDHSPHHSPIIPSPCMSRRHTCSAERILASHFCGILTAPEVGSILAGAGAGASASPLASASSSACRRGWDDLIGYPMQ